MPLGAAIIEDDKRADPSSAGWDPVSVDVRHCAIGKLTDDSYA
jgi:hypothetical protein